MAEYNLLDTRAFENFINSQKDLKTRYSDISTRYQNIVRELMKDWKGRGAEAFQEDSQKVMSNISGIQDILSTMCDTLRDCRDIFGECDTSLGANNRDSMGKGN